MGLMPLPDRSECVDASATTAPRTPEEYGREVGRLHEEIRALLLTCEPSVGDGVWERLMALANLVAEGHSLARRRGFIEGLRRAGVVQASSHRVN